MFTRLLITVTLLGFFAGCSATPPLPDDEIQARDNKAQTDKERARRAAEERELERLVQRQMMDTWDGMLEPR